MSERVFLHVGSPKTGTTFLQEVLWSQRDLAREQGLLLPLDSFFDHYLASLDVRELSARKEHPPRAVGMWDRVVEEAAGWSGNVLVSHELFASATADQAERAITALGDTEVHLVVTARDLVRQIPAEWQEHVKHRSAQAFDDFVETLVRDRDGSSWFWQVQDVPEVVRRWGRSLPRSRVHVVVVPPSGAAPALLWERFTGLVGLDGSAFALDRSRPNTSLRAEQAELLRRVNAELGDRLPIPGPYPEIVKNLFAHRVLADRPGTPFALSEAALDFAVVRSKEMAQSLHDLDVDVVGDLAELVPAPPTTAPAHASAAATPSTIDPGLVSDEVLLRESLAALAGLLQSMHRERTRVKRLDAALAELEPVRAERDRLLEEMTRQPVRHLFKGLSQRWGWVMTARLQYRRAVDGVRVLRGWLRTRVRGRT